MSDCELPATDPIAYPAGDFIVTFDVLSYSSFVNYFEGFYEQHRPTLTIYITIVLTNGCAQWDFELANTSSRDLFWLPDGAVP